MKRKRKSGFVLPITAEPVESPSPQFPAPFAARPEEHTVRAPLDPRVEAFNQRNTALAVSIVQSRLGR